MKPVREVIKEIGLYVPTEPVIPFRLNDGGTDALLHALDAAGYVIVPKEPTEGMCEAALRIDDRLYETWRRTYAAMIEARPK